MKKAFTLIETLVVIGIVILLTIGTVAGLSAFRSQRQVKTTAEKVKSFLMEARSMAMNPSDTSFGVAKIRVRVYPSASASLDKNMIKIFPVDSIGADGTEISKFELSRGVNLDVANPQDTEDVNNNGNMKCTPNCGGTATGTGVQSYYFSFFASSASTLGQITDTAGINKGITITVSDGSQTYTISMDNVTGLVTIQ